MYCVMDAKITNTSFEEQFLDRTRHARENRGFTQDEIAEILEIKQDTYKQYETRTLLPHRFVTKFCRHCRVTPNWLFGVKEYRRFDNVSQWINRT